MQCRCDSDVFGIDISNYQGNIDWARVKASGVQFAYVKATEGATWTDPMFMTNVNGARAVGIPVGAYHFARPDQTSAIDEAKHFVSLLQSVQTDLMPVLDLEEPSDPSKIAVDALVKWTRDFINYVQQATGRKVMLYTGNWFVNRYNGLNNALCDLPLWVANYANIPAPPDCGGWTRWTVWQYASDGRVDGINGDVDVNVAVSLDALRGGSVYPTIKVQLNGQTFADGIVVNDVTYVKWPALDVFKTPYTYKGNGLMNINGQDVQGVVYNGETYLPWGSLASNVQAVKIDGGWNFVVQTQSQAQVSELVPTNKIDKDAAQKVIDVLGKVYNVTTDDNVHAAIKYAADALRDAAGIQKQNL